MQNYRDMLTRTDPDTAAALGAEETRQREGIELIPSENYTAPEVLAVLGSVLTNKYAEGYPGRRYYGGTVNADRIEDLARDRAKAIFRAGHANVQPLSGSPMNQAVYLGFLKPGDRILAMDLSHGGHLTHGAPVSHMGRLFEFVRYKTRTDRQGAIDGDALMALAKETRPKMVLAGYTSYPRDLDYGLFKQIADEVGALTFADVSHVGGLIAGGVQANPMDAGFDIMSTTTHKSLRGPRGGLIVTKPGHAKIIDASVFPGLQGGPHMNQVAGTAVALKLAGEARFKAYAAQVLANAQALAHTLLAEGVTLVTGGTGNHMLVVDTVASFGLDGRQAEEVLDRIGMTANKQVIPDDPRPPLRPSGLRLGTPAATTRGFGEQEMAMLGQWMVRALRQPDNAGELDILARQTKALALGFPVPGLAG